MSTTTTTAATAATTKVGQSISIIKEPEVRADPVLELNLENEVDFESESESETEPEINLGPLDRFIRRLVQRETPSTFPADEVAAFMKKTKKSDGFTPILYSYLRENSIERSEFEWPRSATRALRFHFLDLAKVAEYEEKMERRDHAEVKREAAIQEKIRQFEALYDFELTPYICHYVMDSQVTDSGFRGDCGCCRDSHSHSPSEYSEVQVAGSYAVYLPSLRDPAGGPVDDMIVKILRQKIKSLHLSSIQYESLPTGFKRDTSLKILGLTKVSVVIDEEAFEDFDARTLVQICYPRLFKKFARPPKPVIRGFGYPRPHAHRHSRSRHTGNRR